MLENGLHAHSHTSNEEYCAIAKTNDERHAAQLGTLELLDGREEGVQIQVSDDPPHVM